MRLTVRAGGEPSVGSFVLRFAGRIDVPAQSGQTATLQPGSEVAWLEERWQRLGEAFLDDVQGDFAVALHDPGRRLTIAARDGFGNRYLAFRADSSGIDVSQLDADLAPAASGNSDLEPRRLAEFYAYGELSANATFFRGVHAVLPGEMLVFSGGEVRRRDLRRPDLDLRLRMGSWEAYVERFEELLRGAVRRALVTSGGSAGARAGILLSGGLDSTPLAALAARELADRSSSSRLQAISWALSATAGDESAFVADAATRFGADLLPIPCDDAIPYSDLGQWPIHPSTPEQTPYRWLHERSYAEAARLGVNVVLNGFNGDSLYCHGRRWFWSLLAAGSPGRAIDGLRDVARERGGWDAVRSHLIGPLLPRRSSLRRTPPAYLTEDAAKTISSLPRFPPDLERACRPRQAARLLSLLEAHGDNLERWFAARHGIEARSPLRDPDLVQWMLAVPDHLLQQGETTRPILRAATRELIPESIRTRRSKGSFLDVLTRGLEPENLPWAEEVLFDRSALWRPFVRESAVRRWLRAPPESQTEMVGYVQTLNAELWRLQRAGFDLASLESK